MIAGADEFDFIVLGGGSGGLAGAIAAAGQGARVALLEPGPLGGTCVNRGCVPKKAMWLAAELADAQQLAADCGFALTPGALDWPRFIATRDAYIAGIHASYDQRLAELGITVIPAAGRWVGATTIAVGARHLHAPHVLIATGSRPVQPMLPGAELGIDSDGFFALAAMPHRVAVVGAGYIAMELAGILRALGAEVDIFIRGERLLEHIDAELAQVLRVALEERGIGLHFRHTVRQVESAAEGRMMQFADGSRHGGYDVVLWATGRIPNTERLGLDAAGVACDARGHIEVDAWQNTSALGVYALGDVTAAAAHTPIAIAAARRLVARVFGGDAQARLDYANIPSVVFTRPPLGAVGLTEAAARAQYGNSVKIYKNRFRPMRYALARRERYSFVKLVCVGSDERVVGVHLFGDGVDEMLQGFAVAVKLGARKADLDNTVAIHPTAAEELVLLA